MPDFDTIPMMLCCSHVPDECLVRIVQLDAGAPPVLRFQKLIPNGVMVLSFGKVEVWCPRCYLTRDHKNIHVVE